MEGIAAQAKVRVRAWSDAHRHAVLFDDAESTLLDVASGKSTRLPWRALSAFEEKTHAETGDTYLVLLFENGSRIALVDPGGVAFPPSTENSGEIGTLPPAVCLRDFFVLKQRVEHFLYDHPDEPPPRETLDMVMLCIATLDGARAAGFDVADLEADLEKSLSEIERRTK